MTLSSPLPNMFTFKNRNTGSMYTRIYITLHTHVLANNTDNIDVTLRSSGDFASDENLNFSGYIMSYITSFLCRPPNRYYLRSMCPSQCAQVHTRLPTCLYTVIDLYKLVLTPCSSSASLVRTFDYYTGSRAR